MISIIYKNKLFTSVENNITYIILNYILNLKILSLCLDSHHGFSVTHHSFLFIPWQGWKDGLLGKSTYILQKGQQFNLFRPYKKLTIVISSLCSLQERIGLPRGLLSLEIRYYLKEHINVHHRGHSHNSSS